MAIGSTNLSISITMILFLMFCYWLAYQEGFNIKWRQISRTCLNNKKTSYNKNATNLKKSHSKYGKKISNLVFEIWPFKKKIENSVTE